MEYLGVILALTIIPLVIYFCKKEEEEKEQPQNPLYKPLKRFFYASSVPPEDYTVIDTETTGLDACTNDILEIGAVKFRNHIEVERMQTYVKPDGPMSKEAYAINHIAWGSVREADGINVAFAKLIDFVGDDTIVGYNVGFDIKFLQTRAGIEIKNPCFDVLNFLKTYLPMDNYKLGNVKAALGIATESHSAIGDCVATQKVYIKALKFPGIEDRIQEEVKRIREFEAQQKAIEEKRLKHLEEVKSKKQAQKEKGPSTAELNAISKKMVGSELEYISKIIKILESAQKDVSALSYPSYWTGTGCRPVCYGDVPFFGVKVTGNLRYIVLCLPQEKIHTDFVCMPSSVNEGEDSTRIYVQSPDNLDGLSDAIVSAYSRAKKKAKREASHDPYATGADAL